MKRFLERFLTPVGLVALLLFCLQTRSDAISGNCSPYRTWNTGDTLTAPDLTTSMSQVATTSMNGSCLAGHSPDLSTMQTATDPNPALVPSLPTSNDGELERIRYVLKNVWPVAHTQWYNYEEGVLPRGYLSGLVISNNGTATDIDVAAGMARSDANTADLTLTAALTGKRVTTAWVVGAGAGCLDTGAVANSTWYHIHVIKRLDTGVVDVLCSLSVASPTMPANYTKSRRIGAVKTDTVPNVTAFVQVGDYFRWKVSVLDINVSAPGTGAVSRTLSVPTGINVTALFTVAINDSTPATTFINVSDLAANDEAPSTTVTPLFDLISLAGNAAGAKYSIMTNTSAQIRTRHNASTANTTQRISTFGWTERRGRDS